LISALGASEAVVIGHGGAQRRDQGKRITGQRLLIGIRTGHRGRVIPAHERAHGAIAAIRDSRTQVIPRVRGIREAVKQENEGP